MSDRSPDADGPIMPRGVIHAYWFQILNSTSWSIVLGTSLLLYFKELGASGLVLGMAVALTPLFAVLQIPAAEFAERIGYKPFMVRGWAFRSIFILGAAFVPLLPGSVSPAARIGIMLGLLACFAAARGVSVCGYMPWIAQLIPEARRGRFIAMDTICIHLSVAATMLLSSTLLRLFPHTRTYALLFGISYLAAIGSLFFLKRIPAVSAPPPSRRGPSHPPWLAMLRYPPFFRFVIFNVAHNLVISGLGVVWVPFMRDGFGASPSLVLGLSAFSSLVATVASFVVGPIVDRTGSRPLLAFAGGLIILNQAVWWSLAAGLVPRLAWLPFAIIMVGATGFAMFHIANTRLAMGTVPAMGRSHFFAISSVANSLTLGFMPLVWGWAMDRLPPASAGLVNRFSLLYGVFVIGLILVQLVRRRLQEPRAMSTQEFFHILLMEPSRKLLHRVVALLRRPESAVH